MKNYLTLFFLLCTFVIQAEDKKIITVMDFETSGVSKQEMTLFVDYLSATVSDFQQYQLIDRRQRQLILAEAAFSNSGCVDESCAIEIGQLLSASEMVVGSLGSIGSLYLLNVKLIDVGTGATLNDVSEKYDSIEALVNGCETVVAQLVGGVSGIQVTTNTPQMTFNVNDRLSIEQIDPRQYLWNDQIFKRNWFWGDHSKLVEAVTGFHGDPSLQKLAERYNGDVKKHRTFSILGSLGGLALFLIASQQIETPETESQGYSLMVGGIVLYGWGLFESIQAAKPPTEFISYYNSTSAF
jgi:hypothetical protein